MTLAPVFIRATIAVFNLLMKALTNKKPDTQTQGEAIKTHIPCPNGVSA